MSHDMGWELPMSWNKMKRKYFDKRLMIWDGNFPSHGTRWNVDISIHVA